MERDSFRTRTGFIIACIGSAVGMGNIWLFPARVSSLGGAAFLIPYFICVIVIGFTGVIGEMPSVELWAQVLWELLVRQQK